MSKLEQLINELCPDGVEYKKLKDICNTITTGKLNANAMVENGQYPFFTCDKLPYKINNYSFDTEAILISGNGSQVGHINYYKGKFNAYQRTYVIYDFNNIIIVKYLLHYLKCNFKQYILYHAKKGSVPYITLPILSNFKISIPPLPVQEEIVRILDEYTSKVEEIKETLQKELTARKKQYEYYRDELIKNARNAEYKTLEEISIDMYRGAGIKRNEVSKTGIPCVRYGEIYTSYNILFNKCISHTDENKQNSKKYFEYGDVLFAITGESVEEIAKSIVYLGNEKCLAGGDIVIMKHKQNPKYIGYALSTNSAQMQKSKGKVKSKVVHSSVPALKKIKIPIPPLEEQEKIANLIEKFDTLCNDITNGLPAKIEKRQKQYEYYRDKLLDFKEK